LTPVAVRASTFTIGGDRIDTADAYGPHLSEQLIYQARHPCPKDLVIASKGGLIRPDPNPEACGGCAGNVSICVNSTFQIPRCRSRNPSA
jgi:aryl-alcohol dehydrogenase-like predicted oxidoreductase